MYKLQCHFDENGEIGQQWGQVTINGELNGAPPSCEEEIPEQLGDEIL